MVSGIDSGDFINFALLDLGISVTRIPVTKSFTTNGDETLVDGNPEVIQGVYNPKIDEFIQQKLGLQQETDAYLMIDPAESINKDDKIQVQGKEFRVIDVRERLAPANTTSIYKFCELHFIGPSWLVAPPIGYYPLTQNANDYSGYGHDGTNNGVTFSAAGGDFDGVSDNIVLPSLVISYSTAFSVSWFCKFDVITGTRAVWRLEESNSIQAFLNEPLFGGGFSVALHDGTAWRSVTDSSPSTSLVYYTFTFDGTDLILYKDGNPIDTYLGFGTLDSISSNNKISDSTNDFDGTIKNFLIFNIGLSPSQVTDLFNNGGSPNL